MAITVKLSATLRRYAPGYDAEVGLEVDYTLGMTVEEAVLRTDIPLEKVFMVVVNHRPSQIDEPLSDGDTVNLAMVFGGG